MTNAEREKNTELLKETIAYLESRGYEEIKSPIEGYEAPKSYRKAGENISITPDIVAVRNGIKHYFEIGLKSDEPSLLKSKWQFLKTLSQMKNRRFKVITHRGHYRFTDELLQDLNLENNLIRI